jgi:twitching motility protein PilT
MNINELLKYTTQINASDLHISVGVPPVVRVNGNLEKVNDKILTPQDTKEMTLEILNDYQKQVLEEKGEVDTSFSLVGLSRYRVNAYKQRNSYGLAIRVLAQNTPTIDELNLPEVLKDLAMKQRGLVLVTGPTGSGKSTTLAAIINHINQNKNCHILTLEDPIEYLHKHGHSLVNQREIGNDTESFSTALRSALRQDPDVILVGEMRDLETISIAITAAETGHLVLSTLHTIGSAKTIDRIIDVFPTHQQQQIRIQLSSVLEGVISQQLLISSDKKSRELAMEIMTATPAIRNLVREGKTHQIQTIIQTGSKFGMVTMDNSLLNLYKSNKITLESAFEYCVDREYLEKTIGIKNYGYY